jgi:hypothetical protein
MNIDPLENKIPWLCLVSGHKVLGCHIGCHMRLLHGVFDTNKKQITESVSKPRDRFIKPN